MDKEKIKRLDNKRKNNRKLIKIKVREQERTVILALIFMKKKRKDDLAVIVSVGTVAVILQVGGCLLRGFGHEGEALENDVQGLGKFQTNKISFWVF